MSGGLENIDSLIHVKLAFIYWARFTAGDVSASLRQIPTDVLHTHTYSNGKAKGRFVPLLDENKHFQQAYLFAQMSNSVSPTHL